MFQTNDSANFVQYSPGSRDHFIAGPLLSLLITYLYKKRDIDLALISVFQEVIS